MVSFKRQYPQRLFPGRSDRDPSQTPLIAEEAQYWIDSLNPLTWLATACRVRQHQPEAVILQWWTTFWAPVWFILGMLHRLLLPCPLIYLCHNVRPHEAHRWDLWLTRRALRWGTHFIVQSAPEKEQLLALLPWAQIRVCPHPVYAMLAHQRIGREDARRRLGLPLDVPVLLFFGIVREYKGLDDLLEALPRIQRRLGQVRLIVAGEFWDAKRRYLDAIQRLGIAPSVLVEDRYIPNEEVGVYFSAADLLVAPYRQVTGSGAIQMARGFGLPVVTTQVAAEALGTDTERCLLVPPADPEALAAGVARHFEVDLNEKLPQDILPTREQTSWAALVSAIEALV
jgi:glycosyltransferase involved in cell wall biosynthesis